LNPLPEEVPELQQLRDDITTLHSECTILQSVVDEKEDLVRQLKSDILRLDYKSETEKGELRNIISEKQLVIEELDIRVAERDKVVEDQATKISELEEELLELNKAQEDYRRQYEDKVTELQELKQTTLHRSSSRLLHPELVGTDGYLSAAHLYISYIWYRQLYDLYSQLYDLVQTAV
jgi:chromosome segregation ATPase